MIDDAGLTRFVNAQDAHGTYDAALTELRAGRKRSHWMWFVFPQLAGLGRSATAQRYAISSLAQARDYLAHPVLGPRLLECSAAVARSSTGSAREFFGDTDAMKLRSSMTLFARAADDPAPFTAVLERYYDGQQDGETVRLLAD